MTVPIKDLGAPSFVINGPLSALGKPLKKVRVLSNTQYIYCSSQFF